MNLFILCRVLASPRKTSFVFAFCSVHFTLFCSLFVVSCRSFYIVYLEKSPVSPALTSCHSFHRIHYFSLFIFSIFGAHRHQCGARSKLRLSVRVCPNSKIEKNICWFSASMICVGFDRQYFSMCDSEKWKSYKWNIIKLELIQSKEFVVFLTRNQTKYPFVFQLFGHNSIYVRAPDEFCW